MAAARRKPPPTRPTSTSFEPATDAQLRGYLAGYFSDACGRLQALSHPQAWQLVPMTPGVPKPRDLFFVDEVERAIGGPEEIPDPKWPHRSRLAKHSQVWAWARVAAMAHAGKVASGRDLLDHFSCTVDLLTTANLIDQTRAHQSQGGRAKARKPRKGWQATMTRAFLSLDDPTASLDEVLKACGRSVECGDDGRLEFENDTLEHDDKVTPKTAQNFLSRLRRRK